jgi:hypothetical protein
VSSPFENPLVRYGMGAASAAVLVFAAFAFTDGTVRYVLLGIAAFELVVFPQILKYAVENAESDGPTA